MNRTNEMMQSAKLASVNEDKEFSIGSTNGCSEQPILHQINDRLCYIREEQMGLCDHIMSKINDLKRLNPQEDKRDAIKYEESFMGSMSYSLDRLNETIEKLRFILRHLNTLI